MEEIMNTKRIIGIVILIIGIIAILFANHEKGRIAEAEGNVEKGTSLFSGHSAGSQVGQAFGGAMEGKISSYNTPVMILMIGGIVLVVIGAGMAFFCRKKKSR
jgi:predicted MFS family arabinose efflux permease